MTVVICLPCSALYKALSGASCARGGAAAEAKGGVSLHIAIH